jgi:hypothetical protein
MPKKKKKKKKNSYTQTMINILITLLTQYSQRKNGSSGYNLPFQPKGFGCDHFLNYCFLSLNEMDEEKYPLGNYFKLNATKKK